MTITSNDLTFSYDQNTKILDHVNLKIPARKFSLLIGPTGCGKSTLLKILAGLYPKYAGKVTGTINLGGLKTAMMFQNAGEQFTMATPREEIIFALENLQIDRSHYEERLTAGINFAQITNLLDQKINTMSGGEQQRVALAVLVAMDVDLLLLDEPFASCDPKARSFLITKLAHLRDQGKTILLSDHILSGYRNICDHLFQFKKQQVFEVSPTYKQQLLDVEQQQSSYSFTLPAPSENICFNLTQTELIHRRCLLQQDNLKIIAGKTTLITGANGVGKTSLFNALTKMMPYNGSLTYHGNELRHLKTRKYLLHVAQIFQNARDQFLSVTVNDELALSKKQRTNHYFTDAKIAQALDYLELDNHLDQVVYSLSGGQQKKLQILLMLIADQDVLLIDEPLNGLDHLSSQKVMHLLKESQKNRGQTLLIISHELTGLADWCDYHLVFANQQLTYTTK
ncbi:ABC transporter ATP-binding protein [Lactobacillus sp. ESL0785]|uniref:ATP-binding cassette domain-containing protein n=1 Tax=Lactobacillus sp. ESL0785 TaxID=2983232 RepID=UPI0023F91A80|nr:ABC transporter ATP-binding protein [Lactobacillus sp. ESL0785]WEV70958.1 ABC transporter ATP-binding protein [Lactobacillus sp. ESL0785]